MEDGPGKFVALKARANRDKRVAIYYFKGPGNNALTASEMEVLPSLYRLLRSLQADGYTVNGLPEDEKAFEALIMQREAVLGPYARGAFDDFLAKGEPALVESGTYEAWAKAAMPASLYDGVELAFGKAPGEYMAVNREGKDFLAVARVEFGNVVVLPQPLAGLGDDTFKVVHGTKTAPPHAPGVAPCGARTRSRPSAGLPGDGMARSEFTPWKQVALSDEDWPDALVGSTPHFYVYIISNVGEGLIAKRRSYATTNEPPAAPHSRRPVSYSDLARLRDRASWPTRPSPTRP